MNIADGRVHAGTVIARHATIEDRLLMVYALGGPRLTGRVTRLDLPHAPPLTLGLRT